METSALSVSRGKAGGIFMSSIAQGTPFDPANAERLTAQHRALRIWLFTIAALVFAMVIVGGATRLTDSGLSITEWKPLLGAIPPLTDADWQVALEKYRQIPEYQLINKGMSLAEFKAIYWWEWAHRFLGRFIGVAFFVPFMVFLVSGAIPRPLLPKLAGVFLLGGAQGALGWYMVMSGLSERTDVSQYRLAAHLGLAVLIYGAVLWVAFGLGRRADRDAERRAPSLFKVAVVGLAGLIFLQILLGGFVAGTDAGLSHNTWPLMDGAIIPGGLGAMQPWYLNAFENVLTIQFNHRMLAYAIAVLAAVNLALAWRSDDAAMRSMAVAVFAVVLVQIALGVLALLSHLQIGLALAHQAGAIVLFGVALYQLHGLTARNAAHGDLQRTQAGA
jgi:cytochrome c oxidase assembly protein subunit 15